MGKSDSPFGRAALGVRLRTRNMSLGPPSGGRVFALLVAGGGGGHVGAPVDFVVHSLVGSDSAIAHTGAAVGILRRTFLFWGLRFAVHF